MVKVAALPENEHSSKGPALPAKPDNDAGILVDYLRNSSSPLLRYVLVPGWRTSFKILWLGVTVCLTALFGFLVMVNFERLRDPADAANVVVVRAERPLPIWSVPFPAVTICPRKPQGYSGCSGEATPRLEEFCGLICWKDACTSDCESVLDAVRTERGLCYTFNGVTGEELFNVQSVVNVKHLTNGSRPIENWDFRREHPVPGQTVLVKQYPRVAQDVSGRYRLRILFIQNGQNDTEQCPTPAVDVHIHSPIDFPFKPTKPVPVVIGTKVQLKVLPSLTSTQRYLRYFSAHTTGCYRQVQNPLKLFAIYTQNNCELECHAGMFRDKRGCVLEYMPRTNDMALCNASANYRPSDVLDKNAIAQMRAEAIPRSQYFRWACSCLPACLDYGYSYKASTLSLQEELYFVVTNETDSLTAELLVDVGEDHFYPSVRSVRYGLLDFVANVGGLMALLLGVSVVSLLELLFFCLLKPALS
ncbi:pickpocket protein 28-like [Anopheles bellator]|uniref:pickpocket protein 28-like n=1 Tax=Anopheles bellator TaxID=139047 RepID=UPI00264762A3|nr:pickpocket protein 28-like [Anopheles bellator]